jgi:hypothetical protein
VVKTRPYDATFYREVGDVDVAAMPTEELLDAAAAAKADLGF